MIWIKKDRQHTKRQTYKESDRQTSRKVGIQRWVQTDKQAKDDKILWLSHRQRIKWTDKQSNKLTNRQVHK